MSDDLIRRRDVIVTLKTLECLGYIKCKTEGVIKDIEDLPSADRPKGEWIEIGTISHSYKCSVCGRTLFNITVGKNHVAKYYPYCHCGAQMRGEQDE